MGDLYIPKDKANAKLPAIAVSGPFGAVKEQVSGHYAQAMAERGFIALAFDPSYTGESGGEPRNIASPDLNTEDFSAAVDFLSNSSLVETQKIGIIGICGFGGFALNAAAIDTRIKATAAVTMYDMTRVNAKGYNDVMDEEQRYKLKEKLSNQRTEDFKNATATSFAPNPQKLSGKEPLFVQEYFDYYKTPRGFHPRSINSNGEWQNVSRLWLINQPILSYIEEIRTPVILIHGEKAHSRYFSEDVAKRLKGENKELVIIKGANHTDLYDNAQKLPFETLAKFFTKYLK